VCCFSSSFFSSFRRDFPREYVRIKTKKVISVGTYGPSFFFSPFQAIGPPLMLSPASAPTEPRRKGHSAPLSLLSSLPPLFSQVMTQTGVIQCPKSLQGAKRILFTSLPLFPLLLLPRVPSSGFHAFHHVKKKRNEGERPIFCLSLPSFSTPLFLILVF